MKISISYPPLDSGKGIALLTQNRQFQWFNEPTFIYPVVPASAATLLKAKGYDVIWDDAIAEGLTYGQWRSRITGENRPPTCREPVNSGMGLAEKINVCKVSDAALRLIKDYHMT